MSMAGSATARGLELWSVTADVLLRSDEHQSRVLDCQCVWIVHSLRLLDQSRVNLGSFVLAGYEMFL
jgi:hypothetical protein